MTDIGTTTDDRGSREILKASLFPVSPPSQGGIPMSEDPTRIADKRVLAKAGDAVGAYYRALTDNGMPAEAAETLSGDLHERMMKAAFAAPTTDDEDRL